MYFVMHAVRQIDQIDRRLLKGKTIPQNEKVFSIFEPHTRWISKSKAGRPVELGVPVCIIEDPHSTRLFLKREAKMCQNWRKLETLLGSVLVKLKPEPHTR